MLVFRLDILDVLMDFWRECRGSGLGEIELFLHLRMVRKVMGGQRAEELQGGAKAFLDLCELIFFL